MEPANAGRKDLPAPPRKEGEEEEKKLVHELEKEHSGGCCDKQAEEKGVAPDSEPEMPHWETKPLVGQWRVWYQVTDVAALSLEQAVRLLSAHRAKPDGAADDEGDFDSWGDFTPRTLHVDITYPMERGVRMTVPPMVRSWKRDVDGAILTRRFEVSPGYLMWMVAKEYERIYREHEKYRIWGHGIEDLGFEQITIDEDGVVDIFIGS